MNGTGDNTYKPTGRLRQPALFHPGVLALLALLFLIGLIAPFYPAGSESEPGRWGMFTVNLLFLIGATQAGVVFAAILRLAGARWGIEFCRLGVAITLAFLPLAFIGVLLIWLYGREEIFYWLGSSAHHPWLSSSWLLVRNLGALLIFYGCSTAYALAALPAGGASPALQRRRYILAVLVLISFVATSTLIAWDFGMMLIPHWHSTVMPIFYWVENIYAGIALLIILAALFSSEARGTAAVDGSEVTRSLKSMGILLTGFTLLWLYMFWSQFFVTWFGDLPHETEPLWRQIYGHYSPLFRIMIACTFFIPFGVLIFARFKTSLTAMVCLALIISTGVWLNKYLLVMPVLSDRHWPFSSPAEALMTPGLLAGLLLALLLLLRVFPRFSQ